MREKERCVCVCVIMGTLLTEFDCTLTVESTLREFCEREKISLIELFSLIEQYVKFPITLSGWTE